MATANLAYMENLTYRPPPDQPGDDGKPPPNETEDQREKRLAEKAWKIKMKKRDEKKTQEHVVKFARKIIKRLLTYWAPINAQDWISEIDIQELCYRVREIFWGQPIMIELDAPVKICGDIHGQFDDLLALVSMNELPSETNPYLFLGDYVDRGPFSIETLCFLFAYKLIYPDHVTLLRGNHESRAVNSTYGFAHEVRRRYTMPTYELFQHVFYCMPLCALVSKKIFCMHGGISEYLTDFSKLDNLIRPFDIPDVGIIADLTWSDPDATVEGYQDSPRGAAHIFGPKALKDFCQLHGLDLVARAHQCVQDGYEFFADRKLVTIFSAPNYCGQSDNYAAVLIINKNLHASINVFRSRVKICG